MRLKGYLEFIEVFDTTNAWRYIIQFWNTARVKDRFRDFEGEAIEDYGSKIFRYWDRLWGVNIDLKISAIYRDFPRKYAFEIRELSET